MEKSEAELLDIFMKTHYKDYPDLHNDPVFRLSVRDTVGFAHFRVSEAAKNISLQFGKSVNEAVAKFKSVFSKK